MQRALASAAICFFALPCSAQGPASKGLGEPQRLADGVWFRQSNDVGRFGSNIGWIELEDFVVVIDTMFPRGAELALESIKETTHGKPIRFAIITHDHPDHSFGAGVFAGAGATIVAQENAAEKIRARAQTYRRRAKGDRIAARFAPPNPTLTFSDVLVLGSGKRRVELHWFGHGHTAGDTYVWLPQQKILFTGDACVNGPFNYLGDSDTAGWIGALAQARALGPSMVAPGHGAVADGHLLATQQRYFLELRAQVGELVRRGEGLTEIQREVDVPMWKEWTGRQEMDPRHIAHVHGELTRGGAVPKTARTGAIAVPMKKGERRKLHFLSRPLPADRLAALTRIAPNVQIIMVPDRRGALPRAGDVEGADARFCTPAFLRAAPKLRWVQAFSAGVEHVLAVPELAADDALVLTNMKGMYGPAIADHAFGMLLSLTRGLKHFGRLQQQALWDRRRPTPPLELQGRTMLVVGLGGIGHEVARRAHAFGMRVIATSRSKKPVPRYVDRLVQAEHPDALLGLADVVAICVPLTSATEHMFGATQLGAMKPGSILINVARGKIIDTEALVAALREHRLAGACLDVTDPEPLPKDHALWKMANVVLTPHVSGGSSGSRRRVGSLFLENMRRFASGLPLLNVVNKARGY